MAVKQSERRAATRQRLHEATAECLVEYGYAGTTVTEICQRAELSTGALFNLYPTKEDLIVAAIVALVREWLDELDERLDNVTGDRPVAAMVALISDAMTLPSAQALMEVHAAARTRPPLRDALAGAAAEFEDRIVRHTGAVFPAVAGTARAREVAGVLVASMLGLALLELALGLPGVLAVTRAGVTEAIERLVGPS